VSWPMFGGNQQHSGVLGRISPAPGVRPWLRYERNGAFGSPIVAEGRVFLFTQGKEGGALSCYRLDDGEPLWSRGLAGPHSCHWFTPAVTGGNLLAVDGERVLSINAATGQVMRSRTIRQGWGATAAAAISGNLLLMCGNDSALYGFDVESLDERWSLGLAEQALYAVPASHGAAAWFAGCGTKYGTICCVDTTTGSLEWIRELPIEGDIVRRSLSYAGERVFAIAGYYGSEVYALHARSGEVLWRKSLAGLPVLGPPLLNVGSFAAVTEERLVLPSLDGHCRCLSAESGEVLWDIDVGAAVESGPAIHEATVVLTTNDGEVVLLRVEDGAIVTRTPIGAAMVASPALHATGVVCATVDGGIAALDLP
jgi:outer membrane protein assembly factor BamB